MVISYFIDPRVSLMLFAALAIFGLNIFWVLYLSKAPKTDLEFDLGITNFVLNQFKGLLKMGNPNKNFKHSEHTRKVSIEEVMKSGRIGIIIYSIS